MQSKRNPVHPQRKTRKREGLEMKSGNSDEEDTYVNVCDLGLQKPKKSAKAKGKCNEERVYGNWCDPDLWRKKNAEAKAAKNTQTRLLLILMILLVFLFLLLVVFIGILFTSYKNMTEEQTRLRETGKNMTEELSDMWETEKNTAEELSLLRKTVQNITDELSRLRKTGYFQPLCDMTWGYYNFSCYYRSLKPIPWKSAKEECEKKSAHLVIINGEDEMEYLLAFSEEQSLWVGLKKEKPEEWKWLDRTPHDMTKFWQKNEPNNYAGKEDCAQLRAGNGLNDVPCDTKFPYICEKKLH